MANDEPAELIKLGATAWNSWRAEHDEAPNLSGASLRGLDLSGFDLSEADLRGADLGAQHSATPICQVPILKALTSSKLYSTAPILPAPS